MNDMNLPKLTSDDSPLFAGIVSDLFPGVETPPLDYGQLYDVIRQQLRDNGLQVWAVTVSLHGDRRVSMSNGLNFDSGSIEK